MRYQVLAILIIAALVPLNDALKCHQCFEVFDDEGKRLATIDAVVERFELLLTTIPGLEGKTNISSAFFKPIQTFLHDTLKENGAGDVATTTKSVEAAKKRSKAELNELSHTWGRSLGAFIKENVFNDDIKMCPENLEGGSEAGNEAGNGGGNETVRKRRNVGGKRDDPTTEATASTAPPAAGVSTPPAPDAKPTTNGECSACFKSKTRIAGFDFIQRSCSSPSLSSACNKSLEIYKTAFPSGINYLECAECTEDNCNSATSLTTGFFVMCAALATFWF